MYPSKVKEPVKLSQSGPIAKILTKKQQNDYYTSPKVYLKKSVRNLPPGTPIILKNNQHYRFCSKKLLKYLDITIKAYNHYKTKPSPDKIVKSAKNFLPKGKYGNITYLWGGTCVPKLDCSGFVHTVFKIHNILLPRDADQQYQFSQHIKYEDMKPGDLIFFSKNKKRPTHVGIYIGDALYIHCSPSGTYSGIKINNLNGKNKYEKYLRKIFFSAGRILKYNKN